MQSGARLLIVVDRLLVRLNLFLGFCKLLLGLPWILQPFLHTALEKCMHGCLHRIASVIIWRNLSCDAARSHKYGLSKCDAEKLHKAISLHRAIVQAWFDPYSIRAKHSGQTPVT